MRFFAVAQNDNTTRFCDSFWIAFERIQYIIVLARREALWAVQGKSKQSWRRQEAR